MKILLESESISVLAYNLEIIVAEKRGSKFAIKGYHKIMDIVRFFAPLPITIIKGLNGKGQ